MWLEEDGNSSGKVKRGKDIEVVRDREKKGLKRQQKGEGLNVAGRGWEQLRKGSKGKGYQGSEGDGVQKGFKKSQ